MLRAVLRLARIPNVFTAIANVVAGVVLARGGAFLARDLLLVFASAALYSAGMVYNDFFDRAVDAVERPERPIPSGQVSASLAAALATGLAAVGLALAGAHGMRQLGVAALLLLAILAYDAWLKNNALGPWAMGSCRALNVLLGLAVSPELPPIFLALPLALGLFTMLITRLSRFEVGGALTLHVRSTVLALAALAALVVLLLIGTAVTSNAGVVALFAALPHAFLVVRGLRLFRPLLESATPRTIGPAIGGGILLMPALDSAFVASSGALIMAAFVFMLAGPAYLLKRWYYLT